VIGGRRTAGSRGSVKHRAGAAAQAAADVQRATGNPVSVWQQSPNKKDYCGQDF